MGCLGFRGFYFGEDDCKELAEGDPDLAVKNAGGCNFFFIHTWVGGGITVATYPMDGVPLGISLDDYRRLMDPAKGIRLW